MQFPLVAAGCNLASVWFTHLNCCHGSQAWRRALLLWERTSKGAFWVCWVKKTLRYICFLQMSMRLTVWCPRAAMMSANACDTLFTPLLFLCLCFCFFGARHSNQILCWLTTPPSPWLLDKLLPRWPSDALELLGSKVWTSHPSNDTVFRNSASPPSILQSKTKTYREIWEYRRRFEDYRTRD